MTAPKKSTTTPRKKAAAKPRAKQTGQAKGRVAASFGYGSTASAFGGQSTTASGYAARRYKTVKAQKFRNNYLNMTLRDVAGICRFQCDSNWFLSSVIPLRKESQMDGFKVLDAEGDEVPALVYDFHSLADDIFTESLTTSNAIALWRKGTGQTPYISVLKTENVEYSNVGGVEILRVYFEKISNLSGGLSPEAIKEIESKLGAKMAKAQIHGGHVDIVKGADDEWDFEIMSDASRNVGVKRPVIESILDPLDFLDLMCIGDWNLAWFRKDVIRQAKKGYKGTGGQGTLGGVDITPGQIKQLGEGMAKIEGNANIPMNHDVDFSYLVMDSEGFKRDQIQSAIDKILLFGGIEAAILLGSFTQQDGAAPTLMRHARVSAWARRTRVARFMNSIFSREEFSRVKESGGEEGFVFEWSDRTLYSVDELLAKVRNTGDGVLSTKTRREIIGANNEREVNRLKAEHEDRKGYAPSFEGKQGLLTAMFDDLRGAITPTSGDGGEGGRPTD